MASWGVYTIAGGKGGVGKSTTAASLGISSSEAGYEVALVDADLAMANLADVVDPLADEYDLVFVDTGAGLSHEALAATLLTCYGDLEPPADLPATVALPPEEAPEPAPVEPESETESPAETETSSGGLFSFGD